MALKRTTLKDGWGVSTIIDPTLSVQPFLQLATDKKNTLSYIILTKTLYSITLITKHPSFFKIFDKISQKPS